MGGLNFRTTEWVVVRLRKIERSTPSRGGRDWSCSGPCSLLAPAPTHQLQPPSWADVSRLTT